MPKSVLTRKRPWIARFAVLAMVFSLLAVALPASAHSVAIDTSVSCPSSIPSAGFTDIGGFDATTQLAINCLFAFGITKGTSATTYSPNDTTTRWQMALFLVRQAADHGITIPAAANQGYTDIGGLPQETQDAINQITQLGISKGTSTTTFSPTLGVSRWQMALFLYRLSLAAGVTFTDDPAHNQFSDIGGQLAEAQTAINALADKHIALGTGGSAFSPDLLLVRWQMALFLTRVLAADNIPAPAGTRVTVTPTETLALATGQARTYTATFKNADGTAYTGVVGIQLLDVSGTSPVYNNPADFVNIQSTSDGLAINGAAPTPNADCALATPVGACDEANGVAGSDGIVTFTIRHSGTGESTIPVAWEDLDGDNGYETAGNVPPTEPFALGGLTSFAAGPATEAIAGTHTAFGVTKTTKATDVFEALLAGANCGNGVGLACSFFYDAGDIFTVDGLAATLADFEAALSVGDTVTTTYDPDTADQSNFALTDAVAALTVTTPSAATTVDAATFDIKGASDPEALIRVKADLNNDGDAADAGEGTVATGTADVDGNWTVTTPLTQNAANNFVVTQDPAGATPETAPVDVPTITEGASAGATLTSTVGAETATPPAETGLGQSDTITITFSEALAGVGSGDSISIQDTDGTTATLVFGTDVSTALSAGDTVLTLTVLVAVPGSGGTTGGIDGGTNITAISGFTDDDGETINVLGSGAGRTFDAP